MITKKKIRKEDFFMEKRKRVKCIQELAEAYNATDHQAYRRMIDEMNISGDFAKVLKSKKEDKWRFAKNVERQTQVIEVIEKSIEGFGDKIVNHEENYQVAYAEYERAKKFHDAAVRMQQKQAERMAKAKIKMQMAIKSKANAEADKMIMEQELIDNTNKLNQMKKFTLVHPTATVTAIDKRSQTVLVCTEFDANRMRYRIFADQIIDTSADELDIPYGAEQRFSSEEEFRSAVEYAKLVVRFWAEDKPIDLLYNSEGIQYILKKTFE